MPGAFLKHCRQDGDSCSLCVHAAARVRACEWAAAHQWQVGAAASGRALAALSSVGWRRARTAAGSRAQVGAVAWQRERARVGWLGWCLHVSRFGAEGLGVSGLLFSRNFHS